jgi:hypothetical protein
MLMVLTRNMIIGIVTGGVLWLVIIQNISNSRTT